MKMLQLSVLASVIAAALAAGPAQGFALLDGLGGARGYGELAMLPNDDGSSNLLDLPFDVNFFGSTYGDLFVNNNGNATFTGAVWSYTPRPFPIASQPMIAPFWADVDTRGGSGDGSNNVWIASPNPDTVVVTWDKVGYFGSHTDKLNNFQMLLHDRSAATGTAGDFDVEFRYDFLQWTTGDASGGSGGLGGTPAQAGYDAGDGSHYFVLPGSFSNAVLDLQNSSNVHVATPGLWNFAIRNGALPGTTPDNPLMPVVVEDGWNFEFNVQLNVPVFIDPDVAVGYDYLVNSGPNIASVLLPAVGNNLYDLYLWDGGDWVLSVHDLAANVTHSFASGGVGRFRVLGIETGAMLDPLDPTAFVTGLTFAGSGIVNMDQLPITVFVPVPPMVLLFAWGALGLVRRQRLARAQGLA